MYRRLIASLMSSYQYQHADDRSRHVLSELINSIFESGLDGRCSTSSRPSGGNRASAPINI